MRHTRYAKGFQRGKKKGQNKAEAAYDAYLWGLKVSGQILDYWYEGITLKLADDTRYTPDFLVLAIDSTLECHEVKAGKLNPTTGKVDAISEDAGKIKIKVAAEKFPICFKVAALCKGAWTWRGIGDGE